MTIFVEIITILIACCLLGKWMLLFPASAVYRRVYRYRNGQHSKSNKGDNDSRSLKFFRWIGSYLVSYMRYMDIQTGEFPSYHVRKFIYRHCFGAHIAKHAVICWGAEIRMHTKLEIGIGSIIGDKAILDARNGIKIGEYVNFSTGVHIWTEQHDHRDPWFACNSDESFGVTIGNRAWLGPGTTVLHSVHIGEGAVLAAGAVATKDIPPYEIWAGIPAKKIGERNRDLKYVFNGTSLHFY